MKFSSGVVLKFSSQCEFRDNQFNNTHNLRKGVNGFLPYFSYVLTNLDEIPYKSSA